MKDKLPKIYKNKINGLKNKVQDTYYCDSNIHNNISKTEIINKINNMFLSPDYVYNVNVNIMLKNGKNINEKIIALKDNYLLTLNGTKINIDDINDINKTATF